MNEQPARALVMGASGYLGGHVVKALVKGGRKVRVFTRSTSDTRAIDGLDVERSIGDVLDIDSVRKAMAGCDSVFYCVVDTRAWLKDPAPLYETNIHALEKILKLAIELKIHRFIFTSSFTTIGINPNGIASEADAFNWWDQATDYVHVRVKAEELVRSYCEKGLPGVICNPSYTYGENDYQPTPHGWLIKMVADGKMPCYWDVNIPTVGIDDTAEAMILAEKYGRIGERYLITERTLSLQELYNTAALAVGRNKLLFKIPMPLLEFCCGVMEKCAWLMGRETVITKRSLTLMRIPKDYSNAKAINELHWRPKPAAEAVKMGARWFREQTLRGEKTVSRFAIPSSDKA